MLITLSKKNLKKINELTRKYSCESAFISTRNLLVDCILDELSYADLVKFFETGGKICVEEEDFASLVVEEDTVKKVQKILLEDLKNAKKKI